MDTLSAQSHAGTRNAPGMAEVIGGWVARLKLADLGDTERHWARVAILDTVGCTLAGSREDAPRLAAAGLDPTPGNCLVIGTRTRTGALNAALVNGTASHVLDFDDCSNTMGGHPSAPLVSALFPLAQELGVTGAELVTAFVAGFEVEAKIGMAVNLHHYMKGWHPTATLGTFGVAAAAAHLMKLDAARTAVAIAIAASFASGLKVNFGTMTKSLHVGHCARNGLYAARLAREGFTANPAQVFEHKQGFFEVFNGAGNYDGARALDAWAAPFDLAEPGVAIKQYPCCASTHPAADSALAIVREHGPRPEDIAKVEIRTHSRRLQHTNRPAPNRSLDAKFSVQYVVSRALVDGHVRVTDFDDDAFKQPAIEAMLGKVDAQPYDQTGDGGFDPSNHYGGFVRVTMKDGRVYTAQVDQPHGRTAKNALPVDMLKNKFQLCAAHVLDEAAIPGIEDSLWTIEQAQDVSAIIDRIEAATRP
jgi:2-methylcitrate dehydratase PrpD